jgi:hypothetical protein
MDRIEVSLMVPSAACFPHVEIWGPMFEQTDDDPVKTSFGAGVPAVPRRRDTNRRTRSMADGHAH